MYNLIERSVYNRRRRSPFGQLETVRAFLAITFNEFEDAFIIDSIPLEICKNVRATRSKICCEVENAWLTKGYCAAQKSFNFGYKLHGVCSLSVVFQSIAITPASVHDIHMLKDIKMTYSKFTLLGDMGYLSADIQLNLFETVQINLQTPMRKNQSGYKEQPYVFKKVRKRIKTFFSQICNQFRVRENFTNSFKGFKTRILSKIAAMTIIQHLNKFVFIGLLTT